MRVHKTHSWNQVGVRWRRRSRSPRPLRSCRPRLSDLVLRPQPEACHRRWRTAQLCRTVGSSFLQVAHTEYTEYTIINTQLPNTLQPTAVMTNVVDTSQMCRASNQSNWRGGEGGGASNKWCRGSWRHPVHIYCCVIRYWLCVVLTVLWLWDMGFRGPWPWAWLWLCRGRGPWLCLWLWLWLCRGRGRGCFWLWTVVCIIYVNTKLIDIDSYSIKRT